GVLGITPTWDRLEVTPRLPADWPHAEAHVLYKGRRHHVVIDHGTPQIHALEQVLNVPLLWVMDFNLRRTAYAPAQVVNVDFRGHYGDQITLCEGATSGTYLSPMHNWGGPSHLTKLTVAVALHGADASVVIETSDDEFATLSSAPAMPLQDGVSDYPLTDLQGRLVRVRFELLRPSATAAPPVIDGFRITADSSTAN
ncbi:MAG: hypothetical protein MUF48_24155, partial [Pirellulaceae bacterium]|nr:hypothetical protein [Pirellulaceae bacterium]